MDLWKGERDCFRCDGTSTFSNLIVNTNKFYDELNPPRLLNQIGINDQLLRPKGNIVGCFDWIRLMATIAMKSRMTGVIIRRNTRRPASERPKMMRGSSRKKKRR